MIRSNSASLEMGSADFGRVSRRLLSKTIPGAAALVLSAAAGAWIVHSLPIAPSAKAPTPVAAAKAAPPAAAPRQVAAATRSLTPATAVDTSPYGALFDPGFSSGLTPASLSKDSLAGPGFKPFVLAPAAPAPATVAATAPVAAPATPAPSVAAAAPVAAPPPTVIAQLEVAPLPPPRPVATITETEPPLPPIRPADMAPRALEAPAHAPEVAAARPADAPAPEATPAPDSTPAAVHRLTDATTRSIPAPATTTDNRGFFAKMFNWAPTPDLTGRYDKFTAVYDVSAHVVYMPDGSKIEAHSGLGDKLDDTRSFSERMKGPTPPHMYELTPREELFHGVAALRLNPVGSGDLYGRAGLLAHPYMLGPNGDSNGCVSFKDYDAFLRAYQNGQVKRLAVVASLN
jgi:hypothetical protein